ncbi:MAG: deoxyribodipyrimidine photolyase [Planctomycetes bacterium]|nr:deoxyribodipyrimidine photolyase [Planctomycetota bacterium]
MSAERDAASASPSAALRLRRVNDAPVRKDGAYVVHWMIAARRPTWNFALQRAVRLAEELDRPLVVLEPLRCGYRWASERIHRFVLEGMRDHVEAFAGAPVTYVPYVEPEPGAGRGLLEALAADACAVVTDDFPGFFLPRMVAAAGARLPVRLEAVDGNGLLPMRATERVFPTAHALRRVLQAELPAHLAVQPLPDPLAERTLPAPIEVPRAIASRWPSADLDALLADDGLAALPIDHAVRAVDGVRGGFRAADEVLGRFLSERLSRYGTERNQPEADATSGLSPYLHFGHVSVHAVLDAVARREDWTPAALTPGGNGARAGWWKMSTEAEGFLDELVTWRELGFNMARLVPDCERYETLPPWARATLELHANDPREHVYDLDTFDRGTTHDPLWNAAQAQLRETGVIHNYLRMLWGKKVLEWTEHPRAALEILFELNNRYALDGRDPNSVTGIMWCLGRYDRAWGPERPVYGTIRYMSSENTARKVRVREYVKRWTEGAGLFGG